MPGLDGKRAEIAAVLDDITGVDGFTDKPGTLRPGMGWPQWAGAEWAEGYAYTHTWTVWVTLASDPRAASAQTDTLLDDLVDVLRPVGHVDRVEPVLIQTSGGDIPALRVTMRSE